MKDIEVGKEYWTWVKPKKGADIPIVKRVIVKDIFTIMVTVDVNGSDWSIEVPKGKLYQSKDEAVDALQKMLDEEDK